MNTSSTASSASLVLGASDTVRCPHCGIEQEGAAADYVVPGRIGPASRFFDRCHECDGRFHVERTTDDRYPVTRA